MPSASPSLTPRKSWRCRCCTSYDFGAVFHNEMTLYTAQAISPIAWVYQLYALETLPRSKS
jgi:hypothetical protein